MSSATKNSLNAQQVTINGIGVAHFCVICLGATCCTWILSPSLLHLLPGCYRYSHHQPKKKKKAFVLQGATVSPFVYTSVKAVSFLKTEPMGVLMSEFCSIDSV